MDRSLRQGAGVADSLGSPASVDPVAEIRPAEKLDHGSEQQKRPEEKLVPVRELEQELALSLNCRSTGEVPPAGSLVTRAAKSFCRILVEEIPKQLIEFRMLHLHIQRLLEE
jgi:hypothetical protein